MSKKVLSVRIDEDIMTEFNKLLERYDISQGAVVEMGLKYVLGLNQKDFEKEYLNHIKKS
jgi:antitoxin component of RelBE/YafQ-DinJ toxin-antitoxin module